MSRIDDTRKFIPMRIAVMTVSDTRTYDDDKSGDTLVKRIETAGHILAGRVISKDDIPTIQNHLKKWINDSNIDVIISTGGTGLTGRDVTPEAQRELYEKEIDGFSTVFHMISFSKIGTSTVQSRACAGVANGTWMFALPGSPGACKDGWDAILSLQLDNRHRPCNFVEITPRLME